MGTHFLDTYAICFCNAKTFSDNSVELNGDEGVRRKMKGDGCDLLNKINEISSWPGSFSEEKFIKNKTNTPDITFRCVLLFVENLRSHVERSANKGIHELIFYVFKLFSKTKVCYFKDIIVDENVGWF